MLAPLADSQVYLLPSQLAGFVLHLIWVSCRAKQIGLLRAIRICRSPRLLRSPFKFHCNAIVVQPFRSAVSVVWTNCKLRSASELPELIAEAETGIVGRRAVDIFLGEIAELLTREEPGLPVTSAAGGASKGIGTSPDGDATGAGVWESALNDSSSSKSLVYLVLFGRSRPQDGDATGTSVWRFALDDSSSSKSLMNLVLYGRSIGE